MKYFFIIVIIFCSCTPLLWAQDLLTNGGFELGSTSGWTIYNPSASRLVYGITNNPAKISEGSRALAVDIYEGGANDLLIIYTGTTLAGDQGGRLLRAHCGLKTNGVQMLDPDDSITAGVAVWDDEGNVLVYSFMNGNFAGDWEYQDLQTLVELPEGARRVDLQVRMNGGISQGEFYLDGFSLEFEDALGPVNANLPVCEVKKDSAGVPRLQINGQTTPPVFFFGNSGHPVIYDEIKMAAQADVHLIQIPMNLPWEGTGLGMLAQTMAADPKALILPRIFIHPPNSWLQAHPDQMIRNENGEISTLNNTASLASDLYFDQLKQQIELAIRFMHNSPYRANIIGYMFGFLSGGEWFYSQPAQEYCDYSEVNRQAFAAWCNQKYGADLGALNAAWGFSPGSFNAIAIPTPAQLEQGDQGLFRDPSISQYARDYQVYFNDLTARRIIELNELAKTLTSNKSVTAVFYGYQNELVSNCHRHGVATGGHLGWRKLLESPAIDFLCSPQSYYERQAGATSALMGIVDSVALAGKIFLQEDDSRTHLWNPPDSESYWYPTAWDSEQCLRRNFGNVLGHSMAIWWMDLWANGNFNGQGIWDSNALCQQTYQQSALDPVQPFSPQIALVYDEQSLYDLRADNYDLSIYSLYLQRTVFQSCGAQVGYYHLDDLEQIPDSARLFVFVNTYRLEPNDLARIASIQSEDRTLVWLYAPGYVTPTGLSLTQMESVTGFSLTRASSSMDLDIDIVSNGWVTQGIEGEQISVGANLWPYFIVNENTGTTVLGRYHSSGQAALAMREYDQWRSVFCGGPMLSRPVLQALARWAGVNLLVDADRLGGEDVINTNGDYLYVYARGHAGERALQLPGEEVPNGGFERSDGALSSSGYNCWISPVSGSLACSLNTTQAHSGQNCVQTGSWSSTAGQYSVPLGIRLPLQDGATYNISCWVKVDGLNASQAAPGEYVYINFQPEAWTAQAATVQLASGSQTYLTDGQWTRCTATYTHQATSAQDPHLLIALQIYGAYTASNILIDDMSVMPQGQTPMEITEMVGGTLMGEAVSRWSDSFSQNEQKIYRLGPVKPTIQTSVSITNFDLW